MTVPSLLILGTDAVLAATPATPVQLVHACLALGYQAVVPGSWGDELVANRVLDRLRESRAAVLQCSCPLVARRLASHGAAIADTTIAIAAPPVATARYLRALYAPTRPYVTYVGSCPAADHETIDVWLSPDALASALAERGISPRAQPTEFDSILPPDRRRFFSDPGGVPSLSALRDAGELQLAEPSGDDLAASVAQLLLSEARTLIDIAPSLGCACAGATRGIAPALARATVRNVEPPRALGPIVDHAIPIVLDAAPWSAPKAHVPGPAREAAPTDAAPPAGTDSAPQVTTEPAAPSLPPVTLAPRDVPPLRLERPGAMQSHAADAVAPPATVVDTSARPSPPSVRAVLGAMPQSRTDAGRLPRAYIARRRSTPGGQRRSAITGRPPTEIPRRPVARWLAGIAVIAGSGLLLAWWLQYYR